MSISALWGPVLFVARWEIPAMRVLHDQARAPDIPKRQSNCKLGLKDHKTIYPMLIFHFFQDDWRLVVWTYKKILQISKSVQIQIWKWALFRIALGCARLRPGSTELRSSCAIQKYTQSTEFLNFSIFVRFVRIPRSSILWIVNSCAYLHMA